MKPTLEASLKKNYLKCTQGLYGNDYCPECLWNQQRKICEVHQRYTCNVSEKLEPTLKAGLKKDKFVQLQWTTKQIQCVYMNTHRDCAGMRTVQNISGSDKEKFVKYTKDKPATYQDKNQHWKPDSKPF